MTDLANSSSASAAKQMKRGAAACNTRRRWQWVASRHRHFRDVYYVHEQHWHICKLFTTKDALWPQSGILTRPQKSAHVKLSAWDSSMSEVEHYLCVDCVISCYCYYLLYIHQTIVSYRFLMNRRWTHSIVSMSLFVHGDQTIECGFKSGKFVGHG